MLVKDLNNIKMEIPSKVKFIIKELENNGFEGYVVGGCVRDSILKEKFMIGTLQQMQNQRIL
jgi:hypothetical protein